MCETHLSTRTRPQAFRQGTFRTSSSSAEIGGHGGADDFLVVAQLKGEITEQGSAEIVQIDTVCASESSKQPIAEMQECGKGRVMPMQDDGQSAREESVISQPIPICGKVA